MVNGIMDELIGRNGQGHRLFRIHNERPSRLFPHHIHRPQGQAVHGELRDLVQENIHIDSVTALAGQDIVNLGNAKDPAHRPAERFLRILILRPPGLHTQHTGNGVQAVFHPVMDFLNY